MESHHTCRDYSALLAHVSAEYDEEKAEARRKGIPTSITQAIVARRYGLTAEQLNNHRAIRNRRKTPIADLDWNKFAKGKIKRPEWVRPWSDEEINDLVEMVFAGRQSGWPGWQRIADRLNAKYQNSRTIEACRHQCRNRAIRSGNN